MEFLFGEIPQLQCGLEQASLLDVSGVGNLRSLVVANFRSERRNQHERVLYIPINFSPVDLNSVDHVLDIAVACVCDQSDRMQEIVDDHRFENVEFKVAL